MNSAFLRHSLVWVAAAILAAPTSLFSATPRQPVGLPSELETESAVAVLRINLNNIDIERTEQTARQLLGEHVEDFTKPLDWLKTAHRVLREAGVNQVIIGLREDLRGREQPFIALLTRPQTELQRLQLAVSELGGPAPDEEDTQWSQQGRWFVLQSDEVTKDSFLPPTAGGSKLQQPLQNLRGFPIAGAFALPPKVRAEGLQELSEALESGQVTQAEYDFFRNAMLSRWIGGGLNPGETFTATLRMRAENPAGARKMVEVIQALPNEKTERPEGGAMPFLLVQTASLIDAKAERAMVRADIDWDSARKIAGELTKLLDRAHEYSKAAISMNNLKHIALAIHMFAADNDGRLPDSLDELKPYLGGQFETILTNPITGQRPGYNYKKPASSLDEIQNPSQTVILWEATASGTPDPNGARGYADGHVER
ncbi:MAG: hypothetical protein ACOX52_15070 [Verrucomicrobiota bacterium]|jgi:hypothetical protein